MAQHYVGLVSPRGKFPCVEFVARYSQRTANSLMNGRSYSHSINRFTLQIGNTVQECRRANWVELCFTITRFLPGQISAMIPPLQVHMDVLA
jgi:hypothetical protein